MTVGAVRAADAIDALHVFIEADGRSVHLHKQHGGGIGGIPSGVNARFHRAHRRLIHHLERGGENAGRNNRRDGLCGVVNA